MLVNGGRVAIVDPITRVYEVATIISPTALGSMPQSWNVLYKSYQAERQMIETKYEHKTDRDEGAFAAEVIALDRRFRRCLGNRVRALNCGGATPIPDVQAWLARIFNGAIITENYAATECGGITTSDGRSDDEMYCLKAGVKLRLEDWGEFKSSDLPFPRGEIVVKTSRMASGYLNRPDLTAAAFTPDGWYRTGDIGELIAPRRVKVIDRKKNVFKLLCGEWVSPESVEAVYMGQCRSVEQVFVHGDSSHSHVVAVVVVRGDTSEDDAVCGFDGGESKEGIASSLPSQKCLRQIRPRVLGEMAEAAKRVGLRHFEITLAIHLVTEPFTQENNLLTKTNKICRPAIRKRFAHELEGLLRTTAQEDGSSGDGEVGGKKKGICDVLEEAMLVMGDDGESLDDSNGAGPEEIQQVQSKWDSLRFGDSISCMIAVSSIRLRFGVAVSVSALLKTRGDLREVVALVRNAIRGGSSGGGGDRFDPDWTKVVQLLMMCIFANRIVKVKA